jgi:hypothetical protein
MRILDDFKSLHLAPMNSLFYSHIHHAGGVRSFPYASHCMVIQLFYRSDGCRNPALSFRVDNETILPHTALDQDYKDSVEACKGKLEAMKVCRRAEKSAFVDILLVIFSLGLGNLKSILPITIYDRPLLIPYGVEGPDFFLRRLKVLSERGHVYRNVGVGELVLGKMKRRDNKWHWVALTDKEAKTAGYVNGQTLLKVTIGRSS